MADARLIVVEDDDSIRDLLAAGLRFAGYDVACAANGLDGLGLVAAQHPDLVVLDVNLPDVDGFEICRRLRATGDDVPVIFLTARRDTDDLRAGFGGGGDDYVTKPFALEELTFRIEAVLRRARAKGEVDTIDARLSCGHVVLDDDQHRVWSRGADVAVTPTEFRLLHYLLSNVGRVVSRAQIVDRVWPHDFDGDWQIVETYISSLRRKLETDGAPRVLHTVRGIGYSARPPERTAT